MKVDGRHIASAILKELKIKVKKLQGQDIIPNLAIILVGDDPASLAYVNQKKLKAEKIGAKTTIINLESKIQNSELNEVLEKLNKDNSIHGIIVQRPIPFNISSDELDQAIDPKKDVDGFHTNFYFQIPIVNAVLEILEEVFGHLRGGVAPAAHLEGEFKKWLKNKKIIVVGKGETGGQPIIQTLKKMGINPILIDSKTKNPENLTKNADIIISAVGKANVIKPKMIKRGAILISIGLHKGSDDKMHGDYNEDEIKNIASFYTPTPGGVGPVNVTMLLKNLLTACENFNR